MPTNLIGFQLSQPAAADKLAAKNSEAETPVRYFRFDGNPKVSSFITCLMTQAYPAIATFPLTAPATDRTFLHEFHHYADNSHTFMVSNGQFHEIHTRIPHPSLKQEREIKTSTEEAKENNEPLSKEDLDLDLSAIHKNTKQRSFLRLHLDFLNKEPAISECDDLDENLLPAAKVYSQNKVLVEANRAAIKAFRLKSAEIKRLLNESINTNSHVPSEITPLKDQLATLQQHINDAEAKDNEVYTHFWQLGSTLIILHDALMEDDEDLKKIRAAILKFLWSAALYFAQTDINFDFYTTDSINKFNKLFAKIACVKIIHGQLAFEFDDSCTKLTFTELEKLVNELIERFYLQSSLWVMISTKWAPKLSYILDKINSDMGEFAKVDLHTRQFAFKWGVLVPNDVKYTENLLAQEQLKISLEQQEKALNSISLELNSLNTEVALLHKKTTDIQTAIDNSHTAIDAYITKAKQTLLKMQNTYSAACTQINALQQISINPEAIAPKFNIEFATMESNISKAETIVLKMEVNQAVANNQPNVLIIATSVENKLKELTGELETLSATSESKVASLTKATTLINELKVIITANPPVNSNDNLLMITRKFANMLLANPEYFQSKVNWGGGEKMLVNDRSYTVPKSYKLLYNAAKTLQDPMNEINAKAFWRTAKAIAEIAAQRSTSYRYLFFKVRSKEIEELLKVIIELDINNVSSPDLFDSKFSTIRPDWRNDQEPSKISKKPAVLPPSPASQRRSLSLVNHSLIRSLSLSANVDDSSALEEQKGNDLRNVFQPS